MSRTLLLPLSPRPGGGWCLRPLDLSFGGDELSLEELGSHQKRRLMVEVGDQEIELEVYLEQGPSLTFAYVLGDELEATLGARFPRVRSGA